MSDIVLTADTLARCTGATIVRAQMHVTAYNAAMAYYGIASSRLRVASLLANVGHESGAFQFQREVWNPAQVGAQARYERDAARAWPPTPADNANALAYSLGNSQPGDGYRYRGAGDLQLTGRANFAAERDRLRKQWPKLGVPDFEADPDALATPQWAALAACDYIARVGANAYADACNFDGYCDLINRGRVTPVLGDSNGFANRLALFVAAIRALP